MIRTLWGLLLANFSRCLQILWTSSYSRRFTSKSLCPTYGPTGTHNLRKAEFLTHGNDTYECVYRLSDHGYFHLPNKWLLATEPQSHTTIPTNAQALAMTLPPPTDEESKPCKVRIFYLACQPFDH